MSVKPNITKARIPDKWAAVPDSMVRHFWRCPKCKVTEFVGPAAYADIGTPVCGDCDTDLVYVRTEFNYGADMRRVFRKLHRRCVGK